MAYDELADLTQQQSFQSKNIGNTAASLADPFSGERRGYQNQLRQLMANPGQFGSSPAYQFAFDQGLEALNRKAAAGGMLGSGNRLAELTKYGQGMAGQQFFNQANLLSRLSGVDSSSPAAAGIAYSGGMNRSQDQSGMSAVARALGRQPQGQPQGGMQTGLPSGGAFPSMSGGSYSGYGSGGTINDMLGGYGGGGYTPSYGSGGGFMQSDYGQTNFGGGMPSGGAGFDPFTSNYGGSYDWFGGGGDQGGYSDFGSYGGDYDFSGGGNTYEGDYSYGGEEY